MNAYPATAASTPFLLSGRPWLAALLLVTLWAAPVSWAQDADPTPDAVLRAVHAKIAQDDLEGAIADLEDLQADGQADPRTLATLGALYNEIGLYDDAFDVLGPLAEHPDANPAVLYNAGRAAVESGQAEAGEIFLRRSVTLQPLSPAARLLGLRLGSRGRTQIAYQLLRPWALANPDDHEGRLAAAAAASRLGRVDEAHELLQGIPDDTPRVRLLAADLALQRRQPDRTVELLSSLVAVPDPGTPGGDMPSSAIPASAMPPEMQVDVLVLLSSAYLELGQSNQALTLLANNNNTGTEHPRLALQRARAHYLQGAVEQALQVLEPLVSPVMAADLDALPSAEQGLAADVTLEAGRILVASDRAQEAVPLLERASQLEPWNREVWQELARAYSATGQGDAAEVARDKFQELAQAKERAKVPGLQGKQRLDDTVAKRLAEALEWQERGDSDKALAIVRQEISLAPDDLRPRLLEIRLLLTTGRFDEAQANADAAVEAFPGRPDTLHFRAVTKLQAGNVAAAEKDLRQALILAPGYVPAKNDLAYLLMGSGQTEQARALLQEILDANPNDALARQRLDQIPNPETTP